jgi:hypothetical protein
VVKKRDYLLVSDAVQNCTRLSTFLSWWWKWYVPPKLWWSPKKLLAKRSVSSGSSPLYGYLLLWPSTNVKQNISWLKFHSAMISTKLTGLLFKQIPLVVCANLMPKILYDGGTVHKITVTLDVGILGSNALWTCRYIPTFRRHILLPSSGLTYKSTRH